MLPVAHATKLGRYAMGGLALLLISAVAGCTASAVAKISFSDEYLATITFFICSLTTWPCPQVLSTVVRAILITSVVLLYSIMITRLVKAMQSLGTARAVAVSNAISFLATVCQFCGIRFQFHRMVPRVSSAQQYSENNLRCI